MVKLTEAGPEFYIATMKNVFSDSNDDPKETFNHFKNIKLNRCLEENVADCRNAILLDEKCLESDI